MSILSYINRSYKCYRYYKCYIFSTYNAYSTYNTYNNPLITTKKRESLDSLFYFKYTV